MRVAGSCLLLVLGVAACGDDWRGETTVLERDGIRVTVTESPARIEVVRVSDGEVIFDGLPGGAAGTPASPQVAAAMRSAVPTIEQQSGSYKIEDDKTAAWTGVNTFDHVRLEPGGLRFGITDADGGRVGHGTIEIADIEGASRGAGMDVEIFLDFGVSGANRSSIAYRCAEDEHFLGLGGQSWDVDHRGQTVPLWVEEDGVTKREDDSYDGVWFLNGRRHSTHLPVPIFLSTRGYVAAVDTNARAVFEMCSVPDASSDVVRLENWQPSIDLHLFVGEPADDDATAANLHALDLMTAWVGRPDVPADVTFAPWLDALYGDANVRRVAQKLRSEDVAVSVIWTEDWRGADPNSVGGYQLLENWRVDRTLYPDFEGTASELHDLGFKFLTYNNTFVEQRADIFDEARDQGYAVHDADGDTYMFSGNTFMPESILDLWNPDAVAWAKSVYREGLALGADGWMADFGEWLPTDAVLADGSDPMLRHNRYTVEWAKLNRELQVERGGDLLFFTRSAWIHSQPLVPVVWPGDQQTDWTLGDGFPSVIPPGIGLGMAGFPYYAHDVGGYMSELTEPTTKELWFRWCELGALTPVMRTHHGRAASQNWNWESDAETTAHMRRWSKVHMQLVPYLLARAEEAHATGVPVMRPIGLHYPGEGWPWVWTATDEYLLGDRILVVPVLQEGAVTRDVMLPSAERWYPLLGGAPITSDATVDAPLTEIPAFVPEGAILVLYPDTVDTLVAAPGDSQAVTPEDVGDDREVVVFAGRAARFGIDVHELRGARYAWAGRDVDLAAPTSARFNGADVNVGAVADGVEVTVVGPGTLVFEDGGALVLEGAIGTTHVTLRL